MPHQSRAIAVVDIPLRECRSIAKVTARIGTQNGRKVLQASGIEPNEGGGFAPGGHLRSAGSCAESWNLIRPVLPRVMPCAPVPLTRRVVGFACPAVRRVTCLPVKCEQGASRLDGNAAHASAPRTGSKPLRLHHRAGGARRIVTDRGAGGCRGSDLCVEAWGKSVPTTVLGHANCG